ncbi:hypothetical protein [Streptomyces sp. NPDC008150]|uniref:hypothetical protein n=1 Tax=Streptomyces sp. NPDC008150 TaxID=3364816 RepID=UPI0036E574BE
MRAPLRHAVSIAAVSLMGAGLPAVAASSAAADEAVPAPSLEISSLPAASPAPGSVYDQPVTITNNGTAAANGVVFQVRLTRGLAFPAAADGCAYSTDADQVAQALCKLDVVVAPGQSVTTPVRFKALPKALMEVVEYGTGPTGQAPGDDGFDDSYRRLALTADSSADLVATGDSAKGSPGGYVNVTATMRNDGPGWIHDEESDEQPGLLVHIPPGTTAVEVPEECAPFGIDAPTGPSEPGHSTYVCWHDDNLIEVGQSLAYTFRLRLAKDAKDTKGAVTASSVYGTHEAYDKNTSNDTAYLKVDVTGGDTSGTGHSGGSGPGSGGSAGGGSGTGGGNDPHPQASARPGAASASPVSGANPTATATAAATGGDPGDATANGNLASTGSDGTLLVAGTATAAAVLGGGMLLAARRRRSTKTS